MERLNMVVDYARSIGFTNANAIFWREHQEEIGNDSPFEYPDPNTIMPHGIGVSLGDEVAAVWCVDADRRLVFDTRDQAQQALDADIAAAKEEPTNE
jgi:hypothetical protein